MRKATFALVAALVGGAPLMPSASTAQDPYFVLRLCNRSDYVAGVAVSYRRTPDEWRVVGWLKVAPGDCQEGGGLLKGNFYFYAEAETRGSRRYTWAGDDLDLCVEYPGPFDRANGPGITCPPELLKGFTRYFADANIGRFTVNLN